MDKYLTFTVPDNFNNTTCKEFLKKHCNISARMITKLVRTHMGITKDNQLVRTIDRVYSGDIIKVKIPVDNNEITPIEGTLDIIYEDDYLLIVNKPSMTPVHPTKNHQTDTLANFVRYYSLNKGENYTFRAINRIDRDTSGLVVITKDRYTASKLKNLYKEYTAICVGIITKCGTVNKNIMLKSDSKMVREVNPMGKPAVTHYSVIKSTDKYTKILCTLETGRTHQIRCHMSYLGYPLAGDELYGGNHTEISRHALHCSRVVFTHPITEKNIDIFCPIPDDMKALIE